MMREETDNIVLDEVRVNMAQTTVDLHEHLLTQQPEGYRLLSMSAFGDPGLGYWHVVWGKIPDQVGLQAMVLQQEALLAQRDEQIAKQAITIAEQTRELKRVDQLVLASDDQQTTIDDFRTQLDMMQHLVKQEEARRKTELAQRAAAGHWGGWDVRGKQLGTGDWCKVAALAVVADTIRLITPGGVNVTQSLRETELDSTITLEEPTTPTALVSTTVDG